MKLVLKITGALLLLVLLAIGAASIWVATHGNTLKSYAIAELNKRVDQKVVLDPNNLDISVWRRFPEVTLKATGVKLVAKDTFLTVGTLELAFNGLEAWKGHYAIERLWIQHLKMHVVKAQDGTLNCFGAVEKASKATNAGPAALGLKELIIEDAALVYKDMEAQQLVDIQITSGKLSGDLSALKSDLNVEMHYIVHHWVTGESNLLQEKSGAINGSIALSNQDSTFSFSPLHLQLAQLKIVVNGQIKNSKNGIAVQLKAESNHPEIGSLLSLLPVSAQTPVADYKSNGQIFFRAAIDGVFNASTMPKVEADFGCTHLQVAHSKSKLTLSELSLQGHYANGPHSVLELRNIKGLFENYPFCGDLKMKDLRHPKVDLKLEAQLNLNEVKQFFNLDTLSELSGMLKVDVHYKGKLPRHHLPKQSVLEGKFEITDGALQFKNDHFRYQKVDGKAQFDGGELAIHDLRLLLNGNAIRIEGKLNHLISYFTTPDETLELNGKLSADHVNFLSLLDTAGQQQSGKEQEQQRSLPFIKQLSVHAALDVKHFSYGHLSGSDLSCDVSLAPEEISFENISFQGMEGSVSGRCLMRPTGKQNMQLLIESEMKKVNIQTLFKELDNFGQHTLTGENLSGLLTAHIAYKGIWDNAFKADLSTLEAEAKVKVENGMLNHFEPLMALSHFLDENSLKTIKFATLENNITIKNQMIAIPEIEIKNSALDFKCYGNQTFAGKLDYHLQLKLKDLLEKYKHKRPKDQDEEDFGEVVDDGKSMILYLKMSGTTAKPVFGYDKKSMVKSIKKDLKQEKVHLKSLLNEEWGWFKKDSAVAKARKEKLAEEEKSKSKAPFKIKWDDADKKDNEEEQ